MDSDPQIPTSLGLVTTQSGSEEPGLVDVDEPGRRPGEHPQQAVVRLAMGCTSGSTPYMSARMAAS